MLSTNDIALWANQEIKGLIKGMQTYGVAKSAASGDYISPYLPEDEKYIGIDDTYPAQVYHKEQSVSSATVAGSGFGDDERNLQNTYTMAMIVYFNEKKCGVTADQLYAFIQAKITGLLKAEGYRSVRVNVSNAILNDAQVWSQEYGSPYKLSGPQRLIQINYNVVIVIDKKCIKIPNCIN